MKAFGQFVHVMGIRFDGLGMSVLNARWVPIEILREVHKYTNVLLVSKSRTTRLIRMRLEFNKMLTLATHLVVYFASL